MSKLENLKNELKTLSSEYAKIKELKAEQRSAFGAKLNAKKSAILRQIAELEAAAESAEVAPIDLTA